MDNSSVACVTATSYAEIQQKLNEQKLSPDQWVLDLYFPSQGSTNSPQQRAEIDCAGQWVGSRRAMVDATKR
jgi:hypothetical protein